MAGLQSSTSQRVCLAGLPKGEGTLCECLWGDFLDIPTFDGITAPLGRVLQVPNSLSNVGKRFVADRAYR